jgi:RNA-binding protein 39
MSTKLHVGNISTTVGTGDLKATFGKFGLVEAVQIARDAATGLSKGFAEVTMTRDADAVTAIGRLNFTQYAGRTIAVSRSRPAKPDSVRNP